MEQPGFQLVGKSNKVGSQNGQDILTSETDDSWEEKSRQVFRSVLKKMFWPVNHNQTQASFFVCQCFQKTNSRQEDPNSEIITGIILRTWNFPVYPCKNEKKKHTWTKRKAKTGSLPSTPPLPPKATMINFFFSLWGRIVWELETNQLFPNEITGEAALSHTVKNTWQYVHFGLRRVINSFTAVRSHTRGVWKLLLTGMRHILSSSNLPVWRETSDSTSCKIHAVKAGLPHTHLAAVQFSLHVLLMSDDGGEGGRFLLCVGCFLSYFYGWVLLGFNGRCSQNPDANSSG